MRGVLKRTLIGTILVAILGCGGGKFRGNEEAFVPKKGPIVDKIIFSTRTDESIAVQDVAAGKADLFATSISGAVYKALPEELKKELDTYTVPSGSWSLLLNPIPNEAPYQVNVQGKEKFNVFAIQEVRYAINLLVSRKKLIDEILGGDGYAMYTPMTPGQPGAYRYNLIPAKIGFSPEGDEQQALARIEEALWKAAQEPGNVGRLVKEGGWWTFDEEPITVKFLIRVDDPNGRLPAGHYIADQIEKAGIQVERLERDRSYSGNTVYGGDPAAFEWQMYTEGWGAGSTRRKWDVTISQMYAPWYGYMPGGGTEGFWQYTNKELDELSVMGYYGRYLTEEEYWEGNLKATEMGMTEAVRIYLVAQLDYYVANKERFVNRMAYGMGDGIVGYSFITANVKPNAKGERVLRTTLHSAQGNLFMTYWDPIGTGGFSDIYSNLMVSPTKADGAEESPMDARWISDKSRWWNVESRPVRRGGKLEGEIEVPPEALVYDSGRKEWVEVGPGVKAISTSTYEYTYGVWHHGQPETIADILYAEAFTREWGTKDGEDDLTYDAAYSSTVTPNLESQKGFVINEDGTITSWYDYNFPMDMEDVGRFGGAQSPVKSGSFGRPNVVSWEIIEAIALILTEGSASGTSYTLAQDQNRENIDIITPSCVADIRAKLEEMVQQKHVPVSIKDYISPEEAVVRYQAALDFIDKYGHALIGNGPFYVSNYNPNSQSLTLEAFRNEGYHRLSDYWPQFFSTPMTRIDFVDAPAEAAVGERLVVPFDVSRFVYPDNDFDDAGKDVNARVLFIRPDGTELSYRAEFVESGQFEVSFPRDLVDTPGDYVFVFMTSYSDETPSIVSQTIRFN